MIDIKLEATFDGEPIDLEDPASAAMVMRSGVLSRLEQAFAGTLCPVHQIPPKFRVDGISDEGATVNIDACCPDFDAAVAARVQIVLSE